MLKPPLVDGEPVDYSGLPESLRGGIQRYLEWGNTPGGFLLAVITNDLYQTVVMADSDNELLLKSIVKWFHNHAPQGSYGSSKIMDKWIRTQREVLSRGS